MKIRHTLPRHRKALEILGKVVVDLKFPDKYIVVAIDGPESIDRKASWSSDFSDEDNHKIFQALADQTA
jgi:hypothetical protein